ncbi:MAG: beta-lactamase family protein [Spirochaetes bacterium]|nr:beta-lactamase family protein [Spirochaetota bacterium]
MEPSLASRDDILPRVNACLDEGIGGGVFPGGAVALRRGSKLSFAARGRLTYARAEAGSPAAASPRVSEHTLYDVASLTKVVCTLPATLLTIQAGRMGLDDAASRLLPELSAGKGGRWNAGVTVRSLLSHTSGLPAWRPYFILLRGLPAYLSAIADEDPSYRTGSAVEYSDLGFILLGAALERAWDDDLPSIADRLVFKPLGMLDTTYLPAAKRRFAAALFAPTELGNEYERGMALAYAEGRPVVGGPGSSFRIAASDVERLPWRKAVISGEVHDSNCHYGLGGYSGHAGLFSTVTDMARYLDFWAPDGPLSPGLRAKAFERQTPEGGSARGLGWILEPGGVASHTGFTGTSIRYDTARGDAIVALTNRVNPRVADGIGVWRQRLAEAAGIGRDGA